MRPFLLLTLSLLLSGCFHFRSWPPTPPCPCAGKPTQEILSRIASLLVAEGMRITLVDRDLGIVQASGSPYTESGDSISTTSTNHWQFTVEHDTIRSYARTSVLKQNRAGTILSQEEHTVTDGALSFSTRWYWNVRNEVRRFCGAELMLPDTSEPGR